MTTEIFRAHPGIGPAAAPVVVVQHLRADTAAFLALMHACGWRLASVLAIPYSSSPDAVAVVRQLGVRVLEPTLDDLSGALAAELLQVHATTGERVLVHEVGGYLADLLAVRPEFASMVDAVPSLPVDPLPQVFVLNTGKVGGFVEAGNPIYGPFVNLNEWYCKGGTC